MGVLLLRAYFFFLLHSLPLPLLSMVYSTRLVFGLSGSIYRQEPLLSHSVRVCTARFSPLFFPVRSFFRFLLGAAAAEKASRFVFLASSSDDHFTLLSTVSVANHRNYSVANLSSQFKWRRVTDEKETCTFQQLLNNQNTSGQFVGGHSKSIRSLSSGLGSIVKFSATFTRRLVQHTHSLTHGW